MFTARFKKELLAMIGLAFPIIIAQLGVILMGVTDNIMVGRFLGKGAPGAAGVANSMAFLIASIAIGGMSVIAPMVSKCDAEKDAEGMKQLFKNTFWVSILFSIMLSMFGFFAFQFFEVFQQPANINATSPKFLAIMLLSNIPMYFFLSLKQFTDGLLQPKVAMYITFIGLIINLIGNIVFINGYWGFPAIGLYGSAYATLVTRIIMLALLYFYISTHTKFKYFFSFPNFHLNFDVIKEILKRSIPGGAQFFFEIAAFSLAVIMMGWLGETALAAHQIAINIASTTYMMATGIAFAGGIRVGEAWGHRDPRGIRLSGFATYFLVFCFMTFSMICILLLDNFLLSLYISDVDVIRVALPLLSIAAFFQLSDGIQVVGLGVLRGLADIKLPTIITFVAYWLVALPLGYVLGFHFGFKSIGIWLGLLVGLSVSAVFLFFRFRNLIGLKALKGRFRKI